MSEKKILVPIDFSNCSKNALKNAIHIAKRIDKSLLLVHALIPLTYGDTFGAVAIHDTKNVAEKSFEILKEEVPELQEVTYMSLITNGFPIDVIESTIKEYEIELIVMGTHGAKGLDEIIIGSNAYSIVKGASLPVIVIPERATLSKIKRIALACDYKKIDDLSVLDMLIYFAKKFNSETHILHFCSSDKLSREEISVAKGLEQYFKKTEHTYHSSSILEDFESAIEDYIIQNNIDLMVMLPRHHNIFNSIFGKPSWTKKIVFHTKTPLMTLPM